jgi:hypothetical protein
VNTWIHGLAQHCGPLATAASHFAAQQGFENDPPRGVGALKLLARALRDHADTGGERADEGPFLDGAGAFLALVLLEQLDGARYVSREGSHRLLLGAHGTFDPFRSIEAVLDADDVVGALTHELARAEAEVHGRGPIARVVAEAHAQLARYAPDVRIVERFDSKLWLRREDDMVELDLARVIEVTRGEPDAVLRGAVRHALRAVSLLEGPLTADFELAAERLVPRLVGPGFLAQLPRGQRPERVYVEPLAGELGMALLLRYEHGARFIRRDEVAAWPASPEAVQTLAINNLARLSERARFVRADLELGPLVLARTGDGLDSARLLLPGLCEVLAPELGTPFLAAVPHRDALFACPLGHAALTVQVQARVREESSRASHAITQQLYVVSPDAPLRVAGPEDFTD